MTRFVLVEDRSQSTLFPESLDEYVTEDNPVRVVDVFVDELDLGQMGFHGMQRQYNAVRLIIRLLCSKFTSTAILTGFNPVAGWSVKLNAMLRSCG